METRSAKYLINKDFPKEVRFKLASSVSTAYSNVNSLKEEIEIFQFPLVTNIVPYIKNIAVAYHIKNNIDNNILSSYEYKYEFNAARNHRYLKIISKNFYLTINQVENENTTPRGAIYRNKLLSKNEKQLSLFEKQDNVTKIKKPDKYYAMLTHGYQEDFPFFINLGVPKTYNKGWEYKINLLNETYETDITNNKPEEEKEEELVKLKDHIKEVQKNATWK